MSAGGELRPAVQLVHDTSGPDTPAWRPDKIPTDKTTQNRPARRKIGAEIPASCGVQSRAPSEKGRARSHARRHPPSAPVPFHHGRGLCVASVSCYPFSEFFRPPLLPPRQSPPSPLPVSAPTRRSPRPIRAPTGGGGDRARASAPPMRLRRAAPCRPRRPPCQVTGAPAVPPSQPQPRNSVLPPPRVLDFAAPFRAVTPFVVPLCAASSLECVSSCRAASWKGGGRPYECSVLSCAWNAPRALTGALASTAQCSSCGHAEAGGSWRRRGRSRRSNNSVRRCCSLAVSVFRAIVWIWIS